MELLRRARFVWSCICLLTAAITVAIATTQQAANAGYIAAALMAFMLAPYMRTLFTAFTVACIGLGLVFFGLLVYTSSTLVVQVESAIFIFWVFTCVVAWIIRGHSLGRSA